MPKVLVVAEHEDGQLKLATLSAVAFAAKAVSEAGGAFEILVVGSQVAGIAEQLRSYGAETVLLADHGQLKDPLGDRYAQVIAEVVQQRGSTMIAGAASTFSKDILPRAAALLDAGMLSDVIDLHKDGDDFIFRRVMFAGNVIATVKLGGPMKFHTIRPAAFAHPEKRADASPIVNVTIASDKLPALSE